ncbi:MAG: hypothetical protein V4651_09540 [Bacteroidota bacterium]
MNTQTSYSFIFVGLLVRYLSNLKYDNKKKITVAFKEIKDALTKIDFKVSLGFLEHLVDRYNNEVVDESEDLPPSTVFMMEVKSFESTIFAEGKTKLVHTMPSRRYNTEYLIQTPQLLLKKGAFENLSDIAKSDFTAACRCILYGEATAAAFHILRATEDTLKQFYKFHKKTKRLAKPMWGPMTTELRAKRTKKVSESVLSALDIVRINYRNPTQHPEATYDIESAQDLFGVCVDLINKMTLEIKGQAC